MVGLKRGRLGVNYVKERVAQSISHKRGGKVKLNGIQPFHVSFSDVVELDDKEVNQRGIQPSL